MNRWHQIAKLVKEYNIETYAELGTWRLRNFKQVYNLCPKLKMIGVDLYKAQPDLPDTPGVERYTPGENNLEWDHKTYYKEMLSIVKNSNGRVSFIRDYTSNAAKKIKNGVLDMVFIDALHTYSGVISDINDWSPKVKKGGIICGHDYGYDRFPGVKMAVDEMFENVNEGYETTWWVIKQ